MAMGSNQRIHQYHELAQRGRKKQEINNTAGGWRSGTSRGYHEDTVFKTIIKAKKANAQTDNTNNVKSASITREHILQQAFINRTAGLPSQDWNRRGITMFDYLNGVE